MQYFFDNTDEINMIKCLKAFIENVKNQEIVFLCIGTDKLIGDSFGPLLGSMLEKDNIEIFGTLRNNINANNLENENKKIKEVYKNPFIVVVDSALGKKEMVSNLVFGSGGILPGSAVNKKFDIIGDMYINAIVGEISENNFEELKQVPLYKVFDMAKILSNVIKKTLCLNNAKIGNNHIIMGG